ncbi:MAG: DNA methyltransferase [Candidatus Bathyarchaeia archaeon]
MNRLFFLLSGEHPTLPISELLSILRAEGYEFKLIDVLDQNLIIEAKLDCIESIAKRASMTRSCCLEIFTCKAEYKEIFDEASGAPIEHLLRDEEKIMVRVKRVKNSSPNIDRLKLEKDLGAIILGKTRNVKVDFKSPNKTFLGVITGDKFLFGLNLAQIRGGGFASRNPMKKPFFHPTGMPAKMARCMVNLATPKAGDLLSDFFCGTGSILVEAGLIRCRVLGLDISKSMIKGARENLRFYNIEPEGLIISDSRHPPISRTDCIVTDPPYGRSSSTLGSTTRDIVRAFLCEASNILPAGRRICIATPLEVNVSKLCGDYGFRFLESHQLYVHRSLTRVVSVLEAA